MNMLSKETEEVMSKLTDVQKDEIYRYVWVQHVTEDLYVLCEGEGIETNDEQISSAAEKYVYNGQYDCNYSYWQNLRNLIFAEIF